MAVAPRDGVEAWRKLPGGALVRARGAVAREGLRLVVTGATFEVLRGPELAEATLTDAVGQHVALGGTLQSLNDHWWFNVDGVDVHIDGLERLGDARQHLALLTIEGELDRRPMPRLDQIAVKPDRDHTLAFVLKVFSARELETPPVAPCAPP